MNSHVQRLTQTFENVLARNEAFFRSAAESLSVFSMVCQ